MILSSLEGHVGKQVRSFYIDHEIGLAIDREAESVGPNKRSEIVNELLREALERREKVRLPRGLMTAIEAASLSSTVFVFFWVALVLV